MTKQMDSTKRSEIDAAIKQLIQFNKPYAPKTPQAFREMERRCVDSMRTGLFSDELAELLDYDFAYDETSKQRIAACISALERAFLEGCVIRRNVVKEGNVVYLNT